MTLVDVDDLADRTTACGAMGVSRARFYALAASADFPEPVKVLGNGQRLWSTRELLAWREARRGRQGMKNYQPKGV